MNMTKDSEKGSYASPEGSAKWEYVATMSCSLLILCVGCIGGWNSPTFIILMGPDSPVPMTAAEVSTLCSMVALGHAVAPGLTMVMADKLGRKNSLLAAGIPVVIGWLLIVATQNITVLLVARLISGLGVGLILILPQMYLGEIASAKFRGALGMVCGTMINAGVLFMYILVPYISVRMTASVCLSIATIAVASVCLIPESPYFLAMVGRLDEAEGALEKLRGKTEVSEELELIKMTISQKGKGPKTCGNEKVQEAPKRFDAYKKLFTVAGNRKALCIVFLFVSVIQLGSCNTILLYAQIVFDRMNTGVSAHLCTMMVATLQLVCNVLTAFVIDRLGRRPLICISGLSSGCCVLVVGVYFYFMEYTEVDVSPYGILALCAVLANVISLNIGLMPLQYVVQSEILSTEIKEFASCLIGIGGGVIAVIGAKAYLMVAETWGFGHSVPFLGFAAITWTMTGLILALLPETKGKTLFQIQRDLNAS